MIIVTGCAGFIGSTLVDALVADGQRVLGVDNFDPFYPRHLKEQNMRGFAAHPHFSFLECDLRDRAAYHAMKTAIGSEPVTAVIHLAAKAGVRPSLSDPQGYHEANVSATQLLLEFCRREGIHRIVFSSSSSVYGINPRVPWKEADNNLQPISPYAETKVAAELLGKHYSQDHRLRFVCLRLFTVYGPRQRPDLAVSKFFDRIETGETVEIYGNGSTTRDYTYVDDVISAIKAALIVESSPFEIFNVGNDRAIPLANMVQMIEQVVGKQACITYTHEQNGDVPATLACLKKSRSLLGYNPSVPFEEGLRRFQQWRMTR